MLNKGFKLLAIVLAISILISCVTIDMLAIGGFNSNMGLKDTNEKKIYSSDVIVEDESLREEKVKHFRMPDGSYTAVSYNNAIHRKDSNGIWQDIDNRMNETTIKNKQAYSTTDGRMVFSKKINYDDPTVFKLSENGYSIKVSFANADIKNTTAKLSNHAKKYAPTNADDIETQYKKLKTIDNNTTIAYKNVLKGMTLEYVLSANNIKENIIVEKADDSYVYTFIYELTGLVAVLNDDGSVVLADETAQTPVYEIPAPYMYDANNVTSNNVSYALNDLGKGTYELIVSADEAWINSNERAFPVVIDPTITMNVDYKDTYISSGSPNTNYGSSEKLWVSSSQITFMNFADFPRLGNYVTVESATLNLHYYYYANVNTGSITVGAYQVTSSWDEYSLTWNTANAKTNMGISTTCQGTAVLPATESAKEATPDVASINVTDLVQSWLAGKPLYGVAIKYECGTNASVILKSRETSINAYYEITYTTERTEDSSVDNGSYFFQNKQVNGYMQIDSNDAGTILELCEFDGASNQKWVVTYLRNGYYKIMSATSVKAVTAPSGADDPLTQETYQATDTQMWKIKSAGDGQYYIIPKSNSSYRMAIGGGNDRTVRTKTAQSNNREKWLLYSYEYSFYIDHYYDDGYVERFDTSYSDISVYQNICSNILLKIFSVNTMATFQNYTSCADICTGMPVTLDKTTIPCNHSTVSHKTRCQMKYDFIEQFGSGTSITTKALWTGHVLDSRSSCIYTNDQIIVVTIGMVTDSSHNNYSDETIRHQRIYTLLHELSHALGAPDHYCYDETSNNCNNPTEDCWRCDNGLVAPPTCLMTSRTSSLELRLNNDQLSTLYCSQCMSSTHEKGIFTHLYNHHG